jgi:hypothetical protein
MADQPKYPNLTSKGAKWQKGQSGNPSGRPFVMRTLITNALREILRETDPESKKTWAEVIARILIRCVTHPDPELDKTRIQALSEVIDRCEGKPKQQVEVDINADLRERSDEDLKYYLVHGYWPEEEYDEKRKKKIIDAQTQLQLVDPESKPQ